MLFLHEKDTYFKILRETVFQTVINERPDVLFLNIILLTTCRIFILLHVKYTDSKINKEALFHMVIKETKYVVSENHILAVCRIYVIST